MLMARLLVPGFYDQVLILTPEEKARIAAIPTSESDLIAVTGCPNALW